MRTVRGSSRSRRGSASVHAGIHPPGVGLETSLGVGLETPSGCGPGDPPWPDPSTSLLSVGLETPPHCKACWDTTCNACWDTTPCCKACWDSTCNACWDTTPLWTEWQTGAKILPWAKLCLRAVIMAVHLHIKDNFTLLTWRKSCTA